MRRVFLCRGRVAAKAAKSCFNLIRNPAILRFFKLFASQKTCHRDKLYMFSILESHKLRHFADLLQPRPTETLQACNSLFEFGQICSGG